MYCIVTPAGKVQLYKIDFFRDHYFFETKIKKIGDRSKMKTFFRNHCFFRTKIEKFFLEITGIRKIFVPNLGKDQKKSSSQILIIFCIWNLRHLEVGLVHFRCTKKFFPTIPCHCPNIFDFATVFFVTNRKIQILLKYFLSLLA